MEPAKIRVAVRKRPLTRNENRHNDEDIVDWLSNNQLRIREPRVKVDLTKFIECHSFNFDAVYNETTSNEDIYLDAVQPMVVAAFEKAKVTCFAFGQTGSGKTYTMMGEPGVPGLYMLASTEIFSLVTSQYPDLTVHVSFYEIYCQKLRDLLNDKQELHCREDYRQAVNIVGLSEIEVSSVDHLMQCIDIGLSQRAVGVTAANDESSRSHAILQISLKSNGKLHGKASFIDLAGSERGADTMETGKQTRIDGAEINKSLLALKECIRALDQDKSHTPFRGSKLTQVLKDSFVGNARSLMIANISPAKASCENTLNTLRYADRVRELKKGGNNSDPKDSLSNALMLPRQPSNATKIPARQIAKNQPPSATNSQRSLIGKPRSATAISPTTPPSRPLTAKLDPTSGSKIPTRTATASTANTRRASINQISKPTPTPTPSIVNPKFLDPKWQATNEEELQSISDEHEGLIGTILIKEEDLIKAHRAHVDSTVDLVKKEMVLLHEVDKPGSDVDEYIKSLDDILAHKAKIITELREKVQEFGLYLRTEEKLGAKFYEMQNKVLNIFDLQDDTDLLNN